MEFKFKKLRFYFFDKVLSGLVCILYEKTENDLFDWVAIHFFVKPSNVLYYNRWPNKYGWLWGYYESWYDGPWKVFGFGPLLEIAWRDNYILNKIFFFCKNE